MLNNNTLCQNFDFSALTVKYVFIVLSQDKTNRSEV